MSSVTLLVKDRDVAQVVPKTDGLISSARMLIYGDKPSHAVIWWWCSRPCWLYADDDDASLEVYFLDKYSLFAAIVQYQFWQLFLQYS